MSGCKEYKRDIGINYDNMEAIFFYNIYKISCFEVETILIMRRNNQIKFVRWDSWKKRTSDDPIEKIETYKSNNSARSAFTFIVGKYVLSKRFRTEYPNMEWIDWESPYNRLRGGEKRDIFKEFERFEGTEIK
jgi:hypothetical protein